MKKLSYFIFIFSLFNFQNISAQITTNACACCSEKYNQFDFWLGEWFVCDVNGALIGKNSITKQSDNCLIQEKWIEDERRGTSTIYYNIADDTWNQIWADNSGFVLKLRGNLVNNRMILKSEWITRTNKKHYNQIIWTMNEDGSITQLWEIFDENEVKISEVFQGIYKKSLN